MKGVDVARALYYPSVGLSGNFSTNYSNAARRDVMVNTVEVPSGDFVTVNGSKVPVFTQRTNFETQKISYGDQFNNNYSTSLYLSVRVPIFNRFRAKNQVSLARIDLKNAEVSAQAVKTQLSQNIEQAFFNMNAASQRYNTLTRQVNDFAESFRIAEVRFAAGVLTQVDYLIAKNNLDRANINLISAKYDFIFRTRILDYYKGALVL
jgi:outer membrane protein